MLSAMAQGQPFPTATRVEACKLALTLGSYSKAHEAMRATMGEDAPDDSTIIRWVQRFEPEAFTSLQTQRKDAIASSWLDMEEMTLQAVKGAIRSGEITGQTLENMAGIAADKRLREDEIRSRGGRGDGLMGALALMQRMETVMLGDGKTRRTETRALIVSEGEMP